MRCENDFHTPHEAPKYAASVIVVKFRVIVVKFRVIVVRFRVIVVKFDFSTNPITCRMKGSLGFPNNR